MIREIQMIDFQIQAKIRKKMQKVKDQMMEGQSGAIKGEASRKEYENLEDDPKINKKDTLTTDQTDYT